MRRIAPALAVLVVLSTVSCADGIMAPPAGCKYGSENAWNLGAEFQAGLGVNWGDPIRTSFDGTRFRLLYQTPAGESERALIIDCVSGEVTPD